MKTQNLDQELQGKHRKKWRLERVDSARQRGKEPQRRNRDPKSPQPTLRRTWRKIGFYWRPEARIKEKSTKEQKAGWGDLTRLCAARKRGEPQNAKGKKGERAGKLLSRDPLQGSIYGFSNCRRDISVTIGTSTALSFDLTGKKKGYFPNLCQLPTDGANLELLNLN